MRFEILLQVAKRPHGTLAPSFVLSVISRLFMSKSDVLTQREEQSKRGINL